MNVYEKRTDEELSAAWSSGDPVARVALARRHIAEVYDFAVRVSLDPTVAENVTDSTLNRALSAEGMPADQTSFVAWLYRLARDEVLEGIRQRSRPEAGQEDGAALPATDERFVQTPEGLPNGEVALWAWQAARAQRPRDYSLLDLSLRRKLAPEDIAQIASLSRTGIYAVLGRLRGSFEESFASFLLYFRGRTSCAVVDSIAAAAAGTGLGPAVRREIARHAETCPICRDTRSHAPLAADVFASLSRVEPSDEFDRRVSPMLSLTPVAQVAPIATPVAATEPVVDAGMAVAPASAVPSIQAALPGANGVEAVIEAPAALIEEEETDLEAEVPAMSPDVEEAATELAADEAEAVAPIAAAAEDEAVAADDDEEESYEDEAAAAATLPVASNEPMERQSVFRGVASGGELAAAGAASDVAARQAGQRDLLLQRRAAMPPIVPPRRGGLGGWLGDSGPRKYALYAVLAAATALAAYVGYALGDSIQGGGGDGGSNAAALPTPPAGVREVACSPTTPVAVEQSQQVILTFAAVAQPDYDFGDVGQRRIGGSGNTDIEVVKQQGPSLLVRALASPSSPTPGNQPDEYRLNVAFTQSSQPAATIECSVFVTPRILSVSPTPALPVSPTAPATATRPPATSTPTQVIIVPVATSTPTQTIIATIPPVPATETPEPPTQTPTPSGTPPTPTASPVFTATPQPTFTPITTPTSTPPPPP